MSTTLRRAESVTQLTATYVNNIDGPQKPTWPMEHKIRKSYSHGTGAAQAAVPFYDERPVAAATAGTPDVPTIDALDLSGSTLKDAFGNNLALTELHELLIENTGSVPLEVGGGSDGAGAAAVPIFGTGTEANLLTIPPGGHIKLCWPTAGGLGVTATSADILSIINNDTSDAGAYKISLLGN